MRKLEQLLHLQSQLIPYNVGAQIFRQLLVCVDVLLRDLLTMPLLKLVEDEPDLGRREVGGDEKLGSVEASPYNVFLVLDVGV